MVQVYEERAYEKNVAERLVEFKAVWPQLVEQISAAFSYSTEKKQWLKEKPVALLIGAIPYLAGCKNPMQTAASHIAIYLLSVEQGSKSIFHHKIWTDDSQLMNRLKPIANFIDGDRAIIDRGMDLLALTMVCGYQRDIEKDQSLKKYNPISAGVWDYVKLKDTLESRLECNPCLYMDEIYNTNKSAKQPWGG